MIEIVTGFLTTRNSLYLTAITLMAVAAPFLHLFAEPQQEGLFGFRFMSSFLYAVGWPISIIAVAQLLDFAARTMTHPYRKPYRLIAAAIAAMGFYYLLYTLIPMHVVGEKDLPKWSYYAMLFPLTAAALFALHYWQKGVTLIEEKLKLTISRLITFIVNSDRYIDDPAKKSQHFKHYMEEFEEITK